MAFKTMSGKAPGPGARMAAKPAGDGGSPKQGQVLATPTGTLPKHGPGSASGPPQAKVGKGSGGLFKHPKGNY
jgi:hypothetical protein